MHISKARRWRHRQLCGIPGVAVPRVFPQSLYLVALKRLLTNVICQRVEPLTWCIRRSRVSLYISCNLRIRVHTQTQTGEIPNRVRSDLLQVVGLAAHQVAAAIGTPSVFRFAGFLTATAAAATSRASTLERCHDGSTRLATSCSLTQVRFWLNTSTYNFTMHYYYSGRYETLLLVPAVSTTSGSKWRAEMRRKTRLRTMKMTWASFRR